MLDEIQAGIFDGMTYEEIQEKMPDEFDMRKKDKLRYRSTPPPQIVSEPPITKQFWQGKNQLQGV